MKVKKLTELGKKLHSLVICNANDYIMLFKLKLPFFILQVASIVGSASHSTETQPFLG